MVKTSSFSIKGGGFLIDPLDSTDIFIPEEFSFEQKELASAAAKFSTREVFSQAEKIEAKQEGLLSSLMRKAGEQGLLMVEIPEAYGGMGLTATCAAAVSENITHEGSFSVTFMCHTGLGTMPVLYFGSEEQKKKYLPNLATGEMIGAYALTEADAGSDALAVRTKAVLSPDKKYYLLSGEKLFCTNGGIAGLTTVFAKTPDGGMSAFLVEKGTEGVTIGKEEEKMGIHGSSTVSLSLNDAKIPVENLLGEAGQGHKIAFHVLDVGRWKLGAASLGSMKRLIELMTAYANERHQFGKPISAFELVREKIARCMIAAYLAESQVYRFTGAFDKVMGEITGTGAEADKQRIDVVKEFAVEASILKVFCSEALDYMVDEAVQIYGGYGYIRDYPVEHHYRDSRINRIYEGTNEINRLVIAGTMLKRALAGSLPLMDRLQEILVQLKSGFPEARADQPLGIWVDQAERLKRLAIYMSGVAAQAYTTELERHQSALLVMADLIIEAYALESGLIRALKAQETAEGKKTIHQDLIMAAMADRLPPLWAKTRQALINVAQGDEDKAKPYLKAWERIVGTLPVTNTDALHERIAAHVLEHESYEL